MRRISQTLLLSVMPLAHAGFSEGVAAYQSGGYDAALREFIWLARKGDVSAQYNVAYMYARGLGAPQNYNQAFVWFSRAAAHGDSEAQFYLAGMYESGVGVQQDYQQAIAWYRKAAAQGDVEAQLSLGSLYGMGLGATQSYQQAYTWFNLAAAQGSENAIKSLEVIEDTLSRQEKETIAMNCEKIARNYSH